METLVVGCLLVVGVLAGWASGAIAAIFKVK